MYSGAFGEPVRGSLQRFGEVKSAVYGERSYFYNQERNIAPVDNLGFKAHRSIESSEGTEPEKSCRGDQASVGTYDSQDQDKERNDVDVEI